MPLANGNVWNYTCTSGAATKAVTGSGPTYNDTLNLPAGVLPTTLTAVEQTDGIGNTLISAWILGNSTTTVNPIGSELGPTVVSSGSTPYQAPVNGTISTTVVNIGSKTVAAGTFNNVYEFKLVDSAPVYAALGEIDIYATLGVGAVELDFPDAATPQTCPLQSYTLH